MQYYRDTNFEYPIQKSKFKILHTLERQKEYIYHCSTCDTNFFLDNPILYAYNLYIAKINNEHRLLNDKNYAPINFVELPKNYTEYIFLKPCRECEAEPTKYIVIDKELLNICIDCNDKIFTCESCLFKSFDDEDFITSSINSNIYCDDCYSDTFTSCYDCSEEVYNDDAHNVDDNYVCQNCYNDNYFECDECNNSFNIDYSFYCDDCSTTTCENCGHSCDNEEATEGVYNQQRENFNRQNLKDNNKKGKLIDIDRLIGIEIETEGISSETPYLNNNLPDYLGIESDGSLNNGVEIKTPPMKQLMLEKSVFETCEAIKKAYLYATKTCGLHIHIDCNDIKHDLKKLKKLILSFYYAEYILLSMLPKSRQDNTYCKKISQSYTEADFKNADNLDVKWYKTPKPLLQDKKSQKYDNSRYTGTNIHSIFYRGTLEIRYHSGTTEATKILNWIYILLHIFNYSLTDYKLKELKKIKDIDNYNDKLNYFCRLFKIKPKIKRYILSRYNKFNPITPIKNNYNLNNNQ